MSNGFAVKLPLIVDDTDGFYLLIKKYDELAKQNLKMLVLTNPGERMMDPEFGVGIRKYLFEADTAYTKGRIDSRIKTQVARYLPFLNVGRIKITHPENNPDLFPHNVTLAIEFKIIPLQFQGVLQIDVDDN